MKLISTVVIGLFFVTPLLSQEVEHGNKKVPVKKTETKKTEPETKPEKTKNKNSYTRSFNSTMFNIELGLGFPSDKFKDEMNKSVYLNNPYMLAPISTGQFGGKSGGYCTMGALVPLNGINILLSDRTFLSLPIGIEGGFMRYDMRYLALHFDAGTPGRELMTDVHGSYSWVAPNFGPMLSINFGQYNNLSLDFTYKMKFNFQFLPEIEESYYDGTDNYSVDVIRDPSAGHYDFANEISAALRIDKFYFGASKIIGFEDTEKYTEVVSVGSGNTTTYNYQAKADLSGLRIYLGFLFE